MRQWLTLMLCGELACVMLPGRMGQGVEEQHTVQLRMRQGLTLELCGELVHFMLPGRMGQGGRMPLPPSQQRLRFQKRRRGAGRAGRSGALIRPLIQMPPCRCRHRSGRRPIPVGAAKSVGNSLDHILQDDPQILCAWLF